MFLSDKIVSTKRNEKRDSKISTNNSFTSLILIRKGNKVDMGILADIWLEASLVAHKFIPDQYWIENKISMLEIYLPNSEVYVAEDERGILGFISLVKNQVAAIFVKNSHQGQGVGSLLLEHTKGIRSILLLSVYEKNKSSFHFYQSKGFEVLSETIDESTGEKQLNMKWHRS